MSTLTEHRKRGSPATKHDDALAQNSNEQRQRQAVALAQLDCLQGVSLEYLAQLAELGTLRPFVAGSVIQGEGVASSQLFLVLRGTVTLTLHDRAGRNTLIGVLNRGDCFGEGPLFGDHFRGATVQAETICYLLQAPLAKVEALMSASPELGAALREIYHRRLVESTLARVPLFSQLSPLERIGVAALLLPAQYGRGETIIREGEPGDALYLVESGQVIVEQQGRAITHLDEGDFFGEMSLLTEEPHNADVRALTPVEVLTVPAAQFRLLLGRQPKLAAQLGEVVERRRAHGATIRRDAAHVHQYSDAVLHGLQRGSHVLVRDQQLCKPDCRLCESACANRHGHARIGMSNISFHGFEITDTCRQCRVGAECVEACPSAAIQWSPSGALVITDSCTGCGDCVTACPYDAVQLVPRRLAPRSPLQLLWGRLKQTAHPTIPLEQAAPTHRADKCDLCNDFDDMACVAACPTGALRLMPVEELFAF